MRTNPSALDCRFLSVILERSLYNRQAARGGHQEKE